MSLQSSSEQRKKRLVPKKLSDERKPLRSVVDRVIRYFEWAGSRYVYLGAVACDVGQSLARTEQVFEELVEAGTIRPLTLHEKQMIDIDERCAVYVAAKK